MLQLVPSVSKIKKWVKNIFSENPRTSPSAKFNFAEGDVFAISKINFLPHFVISVTMPYFFFNTANAIHKKNAVDLTVVL